MADKKRDSDSDDSDADYVPDDKTGNVSEEVDSGDAESDIEDDLSGPKSKRRRQVTQEVKNDVPAVEETSKIDVDALWADFKKDTEDTKKPPAAEKQPPKPAAKTATVPAKPLTRPVQLPTSSKGGGGLAGVLNKLGKKDKLSTLEKSKLDWNNFKRAEGIEEDLQNHNRGKDGFLERRDFLERTDVRQFEIEKELRTTKRSSR